MRLYRTKIHVFLLKEHDEPISLSVCDDTVKEKHSLWLHTTKIQFKREKYVVGLDYHVGILSVPLIRTFWSRKLFSHV